MDLRRWKTRTWELRDDDGEVATIRHRPLTQAWRLRLLEWAVEHRDQKPPEDEAGALAWGRRQIEAAETLWRDLLADLLVDVDGLFCGSEPLDVDGAIRILPMMPDLMNAFSSHLMKAAEVTTEQGKSSEPSSM